MVCGAVLHNPQITAIESAGAKGLKRYETSIHRDKTPDHHSYVCCVCVCVPMYFSMSLKCLFALQKGT